MKGSHFAVLAQWCAKVDVDPVWRLQHVRGRTIAWCIMAATVGIVEIIANFSSTNWPVWAKAVPALPVLLFLGTALVLSRTPSSRFRICEAVEVLVFGLISVFLTCGTLQQIDPVQRHRNQVSSLYLATVPSVALCMRARLYIPYAVVVGLLNALGTLWVERHHGGMPFPEKVVLSNLVVCGVFCSGSAMQGMLMKKLQVAEAGLKQEKLASEALVSMLCDGFCVVAADGSTILRSDAKFDGMMGRRMTNESLQDSMVSSGDSDPQLSLFQEVFRRIAAGDETLTSRGGVVPVTLKGFGGSRIPSTLYVVGRRGAAGANEASGSTTYLVGISQTLEEERQDALAAAVCSPGTRRPAEDVGSSISVLDGASEAQTSVVFHRQGSPDAFHSIARLGRREHWYIRDEEISISGAPLGRGACGCVLPGLYYGSPIAVKVVGGIGERTSSKGLDYLVQELRVLRRCRHECLVHFYGAVFEPSLANMGLVLERVSAGSLTQLMATQRLKSADLFNIMDSSCCGLWYLHSRSPVVVHGDLKSDNVLIEMTGAGPRAKLADFGLSSVLGRGSRRFRRVGTFAWMAPEVYRCEVPMHPPADVFSFGRLMQFLVTGKRPHDGVPVEELQRQLHRGVVTQPGRRLFVGELARLLAPLAEACLAPRWQDRPVSHELRAALLLTPKHALLDTDSEALPSSRGGSGGDGGGGISSSEGGTFWEEALEAVGQLDVDLEAPPTPRLLAEL